MPGTPIVVTTRIEFWGTQADGSAWPPSKAAAIEAAVQARLGTLTAPDGTKIEIDVVATTRAGGAGDGTPGSHQIQLVDVPPAGMTSIVHPGALGEDRAGEWGANEPAGRLAHEVLHLAGLKDQYDALAPTYEVNGTSYPLPVYSGDGSMASKATWVETVLFPAVDLLEAQYGRGEIKSGVPAGHENDIMADPTNPAATVTPEDLERIVGNAGVRVRGNPGDLLLDKDATSQNFGVGHPLALYAPRAETAHVDGLYVYCIDFTEHIPLQGQLFDVLGPAEAQPEPQLQDLQALLETIAEYQDPESLDAPDGAQLAVWAVTDASDPFLPAGLAFLAEAGLELDPELYGATPHLENPNADGPTTAAVSRAAVLPPIDVERGPGPPLAGAPQLVTATLEPTLVARGSPDPLALRVFLEGGADALRVTIERKRGRKWKAVGAAVELSAPIGLTQLELDVPKKKGEYRRADRRARGRDPRALPGQEAVAPQPPPAHARGGAEDHALPEGREDALLRDLRLDLRVELRQERPVHAGPHVVRRVVAEVSGHPVVERVDAVHARARRARRSRSPRGARRWPRSCG